MARHSKSKKKKTTNRSTKKGASGMLPNPPRTASSSLYALLEVAVDADLETIRQQYLRLVRIHTPEVSPDTFQAIRAAYDVLKDPQSRRQYDRERFYGKSLSNLNEQVGKLLTKGRGQEAMRLLHQIVDIKPNPDSYMLMADGYLAFGKIKDATESYLKAVALEDDIEDKVRLGIRWSHLVGYDGDDQGIIDSLLSLADQYPKVGPMLVARELLVHYLHEGQLKRGMAYFRRLIPRKKYLTERDFVVYLDWLNVLNEQHCYFEFDQLLESKVKPAVEKAAEGPHRDAIKAMLLTRIEVDTELTDWRSKAIIANLAYLSDPADRSVRKLWREYVDRHLLLSQIEDLITDLRVPTTVVHQILDGLYDKYQVKYADTFAQSLKTRPRIDETLSEAAAIEFMAQTYPRVYRTFKAQFLSWQSRAEG